MAKKEWTDEERKAFGEKMRAARAKKQTETQNEVPLENHSQVTQPEPEIEYTGTPVETVATSNDTNELLRRLIEIQTIMAEQGLQTSNPTGLQTQNGQLLGTVERYSVDPNDYPNPIERLMEEPKLQRFAFKQNYELQYEIAVSEYTTIDNIRQREPKFTLELDRIVFNEETGLPTNGRYRMSRVILHEDPDAALAIAREQGIDVDTSNEKSFLDEMRYLRFRDWLIECFYPPVSTDTTKNHREMSVDGKLVDYFEVNAEVGTTIGKMPYDKLGNKL